MSSAFRRAKKAAPPSPAADASPSPTSSSSSSTPSTSTSTSSKAFLGNNIKGIKPWAGGIHLTSVGLNDLDTILGGAGQPLGTCILLQEDRWTKDLATSIVKYWCAEGISQEQCLLVPNFSYNNMMNMENLSLHNVYKDYDYEENQDNLVNLLLSLPRNLHWDKQKRKLQHSQTDNQNASDNNNPGGSGALSSLDILEEQDEDDDDDDDELAKRQAEEGLENAWQYRKSVQQQRYGGVGEDQSKPSSSSSSSSTTASTGSFATTTTTTTTNNVYCHSYDLSGRLNDQSPIDVDQMIVPIELSAVGRLPTTAAIPLSSQQMAGFAMFRELIALIQKKKKEQQEEKGGVAVIRLLLYHPKLEILAIALPLILCHIRQESLPVVIMICTVPIIIDDNSSTTIQYQSWTRLCRTCDVVLTTEGFASRKEYPPPSEFRHLQGLLTIVKCNTATAPTANNNSYGGHFADFTTTKRPAAFMYGLKRDRRKLHIPLLHIPPEEFAQGGTGSTSGVRSGGGKNPSASFGSASSKPKANNNGMGCASNLSGSVLDF